ncbi:MAG: thioredoxin [Candidatus Omnitrophica bacterium]|nr:thioredoxin [Candidatus Omnitrophota bacterium]
MGLLNIDDNNFKKEVLESKLPVMVDFWAPWCAPCKAISGVIEELAKEYEKRLLVAKVNIDQSSKVATDYGIMSIPTVMFFKKGSIVGQVVGVASKSDFKKKIESSL